MRRFIQEHEGILWAIVCGVAVAVMLRWLPLPTC